jgi:hypothetical protein
MTSPPATLQGVLSEQGARTEELQLIGKVIQGHPVAVLQKVREYGLELNYDSRKIPFSARRSSDPEGTSRYFVFMPQPAENDHPSFRSLVIGDTFGYGSAPAHISPWFRTASWSIDSLLRTIVEVKKDIPDADIILCTRMKDDSITYNPDTPLAYIFEKLDIQFPVFRILEDGTIEADE